MIFYAPRLAETLCAIVVLATTRPGACLVVLDPTALILVWAIEIMVEVSGPANPVMWPIAIVAVVVVTALGWDGSRVRS